MTKSKSKIMSKIKRAERKGAMLPPSGRSARLGGDLAPPRWSFCLKPHEKELEAL